ncbi:pro-sigmaK processing inhibitor BofA family protein [Paenibacillus eucommiae]|uniref:Inhibitor of the pro-sigma K processing machinery n=1 Tax=Paenibacillus eucommiae TaxID=1355755 RepID=A0ABS4J6U8_9BACL|nr:pro-sigmaK processing inhibitor BofA family protein [Paenibacillus eucommiae]MBP1994981.1 inhibitor of the pro-sigma K processing machinery [Paenibacillus eucommiae]
MVIPYVMWALLVVSSLLLLYVLFRSGQAGRWISVLAMNIVFAALILYVINLFGSYTHMNIPMNYLTLAVVALLGIPGVLLLIALKIVLL